jgi:hypothetical protein
VKTIIIATAFVAAITPTYAQTIDTTYNEPVVKARCSAEWGTEYDMVSYCMDRNKAGHHEFQNTVEHTKTLRGIQQALVKCRVEWGDEWDMVNYCANTQISSARQIMTLTDGLPKDVGDEITSRCSAEWGNEFDMIAYCMTTRIAAWRKIN